MGFGGIGVWQLLIILAIVVLLFGTKRLSSIGTDLGKAIKGFKKSVSDDETENKDSDEDKDEDKNVEDQTDKSQQDSARAGTQSKTKTGDKDRS